MILCLALFLDLMGYAEEKSALSLAESISTFGFSLFQQVQKSDENVLFSPYSIFSCVSMAYVGAAGKTAEEMQQTLALKLKQNVVGSAFSSLESTFIPSTVHMANALWTDQDTFFLSDFLHVAERQMGAKVASVDFSDSANVVSQINQWVENATDRHILTLVEEDDIDSSTRMVLTNALFFQGVWQKGFDAAETKETSFWKDENSSVSTSMMHQQEQFLYGEDEEMQWIALPFQKEGEKELDLLILLPKNRTGWQEKKNQLSARLIDTYLTKSKMELVALSLPRFCIELSYDLKAPLQSLGMKSAFTDEANFSKINGMQDLFLNKTLHKTFFSLDEKGVTAASATAASMNIKSALGKEPPKPFLADHPFFFLLIEKKSKTPLFLGLLTNP